MDCFYLGTNKGHWLRLSSVPLFVSHRTLRKFKTLPQAKVRWSLDSGGFTELLMNGKWVTTPEEYVTAIRRYKDEIGNLDWASQQDLMCEDAMLARTGLTVADHQRLTIENFLTLRYTAADLPIIPVIQGQTADDYLRHIDAFNNAGIDLTKEKTVGIGSVCRRQATNEIATIIHQTTNTGIKLHGFGMKTLGLQKVHHLMQSADSMAWSFTARIGQIHLPECTHKAQRCSDCLTYATLWRNNLMNKLPITVPAYQPTFFEAQYI